jgi:hypothetical protein
VITTDGYKKILVLYREKFVSLQSLEVNPVAVQVGVYLCLVMAFFSYMVIFMGSSMT